MGYEKIAHTIYLLINTLAVFLNFPVFAGRYSQ